MPVMLVVIFFLFGCLGNGTKFDPSLVLSNEEISEIGEFGFDELNIAFDSAVAGNPDLDISSREFALLVKELLMSSNDHNLVVRSVDFSFGILNESERRVILRNLGFLKGFGLCTLEARSQTENRFGDGFTQDNKGDAFRHTFWQGCLATKTSLEFAKLIGDAHEDVPQIESVKAMDLNNNAMGRALYRQYPAAASDYESLAQIVLAQPTLYKPDVKFSDFSFPSGSRIFYIMEDSQTEDTVIYEDFVRPNIAERNPTAVATFPSGLTASPQTGNSSFSVRAKVLPLHTSVRIQINLHILQTWDGNSVNGPDQITINVGGSSIFTSTFSNTSGVLQDYPAQYPGGSFARATGATSINSLGLTPIYGPSYADSSYAISIAIPHSQPSLMMSCVGSGLEPVSNESWAISKIIVTAIP